MDKRFSDDLWDTFPFYMFRANYLHTENFLQKIVDASPATGVDRMEIEMSLRSVLSIMSPKNYPHTNPVVIDKTIKSGGQNIVDGIHHVMNDIKRNANKEFPAGTEAFVVGKDIAITPGRVVFKNHMIEIIQYKPVTEKVHAEPILIVPAWIMKYYIFDLETKNSMFKWLVDQGHTVYTISWLNPVASDSNLGMEDYRIAIRKAIHHVASAEAAQVHVVGYCLGGTMTMITAATMAREADDSIASITLMAAQTDFTEAGEVRAFLDEKQLGIMDKMMAKQGYLDGKQMASAFQLMRPDELIWSKMIREYAMGERDKMTAMGAWNADTTRMPATMHSEYLHKLFVENQLAAGKYEVEARPISLKDITVPMFVVGGSQDHIAPSKSVFKVVNLVDGEVTLCLASGGHNQGMITHPSSGKGSHEVYGGTVKGSWWTSLNTWMNNRSSGDMVEPSYIENENDVPAPGEYVFVR